MPLVLPPALLLDILMNIIEDMDGWTTIVLFWYIWQSKVETVCNFEKKKEEKKKKMFKFGKLFVNSNAYLQLYYTGTM